MQQIVMNISIPDGLDFSDLKLSRDPDGSVSFDLGVIKQICAASNIPLEQFTETPEDNVSALLVTWYEHHVKNGGERDPVAEDLLFEAVAEESAGQAVSHAPGRG